MQGTFVRGQYIEFAVVVRGQRQPIYRRPSDNQPFVAGIWNQPYTLEVRNLFRGRLEILSSIDGRNTLMDEEADLQANRGMIVGSHSVWQVTGWRLSDSKTAQFVFTDPSAAIATQATGSSRNAGVIGFAVYTEQQYQPPPVYRGNPGVLGCDFEGPVSKGGDMGTGMGDSQHDAVGRTSFTRAQNWPIETLTIQYRSVQWLEQHGIIATDEPNAFPGSDTGYNKYRR